ncbi:hypothetical protein R8Z50_12025 [Longispora sp. K20-0274]|uniref:hypothetical protein n=1 Tax=Longispora sp. K20-0274 TaxID=3088255 RepID=UPI00399C17F2
MSKIAKIATVAALAVPILLGAAGTANASTPAGCSSVTQIGSTAYLNVGGQTMASVKQYKGCGKNYAYLYVWEGYRNTHSNWEACVSVTTNSAHTFNDTNCGGSGGPVEIWSFGASTLAQCTQATGWNSGWPPPLPGDVIASTDVRC